MKHLLISPILAGALITSAFANSIHEAARSGDVSVVQTLLNTGIDVNKKNEDGWTPLHIAASKNHKTIVELLIENGAEINSLGETSSIFIWQGGFTPLHYAAVNGHKEIVELLINKGANVNAKTDDGLTPRDWAIKRNHTDIVDLLRSYGGKTNSIHFQVRDGDLEGVQDYLDAGLDINAKDQNGSTPLHWAALEGHKEIVEFLINKQADVNAKDNTGNTPLDLAIRYERLSIADLLRAEGGNTAEELITLINAATNGDFASVQEQLDAGVDINARDKNGWTPLHWAALGGYTKIVGILIDNGAQINATDELGDTPLDFANVESAKLLILKGGKTGMQLALMPQLIYNKGKLIIKGWEGLKYEVLYSSNLKTWQVLDIITLESSEQNYIDKQPTKQKTRFYKLRLTD